MAGNDWSVLGVGGSFGERGNCEYEAEGEERDDATSGSRRILSFQTSSNARQTREPSMLNTRGSKRIEMVRRKSVSTNKKGCTDPNKRPETTKREPETQGPPKHTLSTIQLPPTSV